ncbi:tyrosine recombinase XerC, partial [Striga asiatica]
AADAVRGLERADFVAESKIAIVNRTESVEDSALWAGDGGSASQNFLTRVPIDVWSEAMRIGESSVERKYFTLERDSTYTSQARFHPFGGSWNKGSRMPQILTKDSASVAAWSYIGCRKREILLLLFGQSLRALELPGFDPKVSFLEAILSEVIGKEKQVELFSVSGLKEDETPVVKSLQVKSGGEEQPKARHFLSPHLDLDFVYQVQ